MSALTVGTLFSGIEGFGLGLERAGWRVLWQAEIELEERGPRKGQPKRRQRNQEVLARHFPHARQLGDVRGVNRGTADPVDLIAGGFPCQDISVAGRRAGLAGERSALWWEFHRVVADLRPRWVLVENTPGLLSSNDGRDMGTIIGALAKLGYVGAWRVLDAQHFGLAQRRERLFIACHLGASWSAPAQILLEPESMPGDPAPRGEAPPVAAALTARGAGTGRVPGGADDNDARGGRLVVGPLMASAETSYRIGAEEAAGGHVIAHAVTASQQRLDATAETLVAATLTAAPAGNGRRQEDDTNLVVTHTLTAEGADASEDGTGRGTPLLVVTFRKSQRAHHPDDGESWVEDDLANTLDAAGHGPRTSQAILEEEGVRRLTPLECERLQGFPDGWTAGHPDGPRYRMLGNAVPVPVVEWIGRRMIAVEQDHTEEIPA